MNGSKPFSWRARGRSFLYAFKGIAALLRCEHNAWIHLCVTLGVVGVGLVCSLQPWEWCAVAISIGGVFAAEAFNSAIEALADKVSPNYDPLVGKAKDLAAAGVLLFVFGAIAVGLIVFLPHLISLLNR